MNILAQGETRAGRYEATEPSAANLQSLRMTGSEAPNNSLAKRKASVHHDTSEVDCPGHGVRNTDRRESPPVPFSRVVAPLFGENEPLEKDHETTA